MRIGVQVAILVVLCSLGGLALAGGLFMGQEGIERRLAQMGDDAATLRRVRHLEDSTRHCLVICDLVFGSGSTYLIEGACEQTLALLDITDEVREAELFRGLQGEVTSIRKVFLSLEARLEKAMSLDPERLEAMLGDLDDDAMTLVAAFEEIKAAVGAESERRSAGLADYRSMVHWLSLAACVAYGFVMFAAWRLAVRHTVRPLRDLTNSVERAVSENTPLDLIDRGPGEVLGLARSFHGLVNQLEQRVEERTAGLRGEKERAERAEAVKTNFLANMSHEIRTPMTAILGYAELLAEELSSLSEPSYESRDAIETIRRSGEHLLVVINDILDLTKIEAGKMTLEAIECNPVEIVAEVVTTMGAMAEGKGIKLCAQTLTSMPGQILIDATRLRQILLNLVGNAVKFTNDGSIDVLVSYSADDELGSSIIFEVIDTGVGMTREQSERIFEPFVQADESTTRRFGGTGMGLSISSTIVELMGGTIEVTSAPNVGSTFTVRLPAVPGPTVELVDDPLPPTSGRAVFSEVIVKETKGRVLLVEDQPDNQRLVAHYVRRAGFSIDLANNGEDGVRQAMAALDRGEPFDIVFMDMQMPVQDGYSAARELRTRGYKHLIVALTAHALQGDRQRCLDAGCDDFMTKPVNRTVLLQALAGSVDPLQRDVESAA